MASDDGTCCVAAMAGNGLAGEASLNGDHPSNDKHGCDVVQGCRVHREGDDRQKDDGEEEHGKEVDREEEHGKEDNREEEHGKEDNREEGHGEKVDRKEAGWRIEPVVEGRAA